MSNKAFIFDMDGVLIDSESAWVPHQQKFSKNLFGDEVYAKIGSTVGLSIDTIYENAVKHGFEMDMDEYYAVYDKQAQIIYSEAEPTQDISYLISYLQQHGFKIGLVSSSRGIWIELALNKLDIKDAFDYILSLNDEKAMKPKPHPDGYLAAMQALSVTPEHAFILEDSNFGIAAARASGAYTIGYTEHLLPDYVQHGADAYASDVGEIIELITNKRR
jgi:HAD superfamily hydrolase (TIGR01509 family)